MIVGANTFVTVDYVLRDEGGDVLDDSKAEGGEPLEYVHGYGMIVAGLEAALAGMSEGESKDVAIPPEEAYGLHDESLVTDVPLEDVPENVTVGDELELEGDDDATLVMVVVEVKADCVVVDANHPLAGLTLRYRLTVRSIRVATEPEIEEAATAFDELRAAQEAPSDVYPIYALRRGPPS